jgi:hypothetical protein
LSGGSAVLTVAIGFVLISEPDEQLIRSGHRLDELVRAPIQDTITGSPNLDQTPVGTTTRQHRIQRRRLPLRFASILTQGRTQSRILTADRHARTGRYVHLDETPRSHREHYDRNIEFRALPSTLVRDCWASTPWPPPRRHAVTTPHNRSTVPKPGHPGSAKAHHVPPAWATPLPGERTQQSIRTTTRPQGDAADGAERRFDLSLPGMPVHELFDDVIIFAEVIRWPPPD